MFSNTIETQCSSNMKHTIFAPVNKPTKKALMTKPISNLDNQHDPEHSPGRIHMQELNNVVP